MSHLLPVSVGVLSPHPVLREGLRSLLEPRVRAVTEVGGHGDALPAIDVLLYDLEDLDVHGSRALAGLVEVVAVLGVERMFRPDLRGTAQALGVFDIVPVEVDAVTLVRAIERVSRATSVLPQELPGRSPLTPREAEVVGLLAQGLSNQQIADHLHLSINSVKTHLRSSYRRIGAVNRAQAVRWWLQQTDVAANARRDPPADR